MEVASYPAVRDSLFGEARFVCNVLIVDDQGDLAWEAAQTLIRLFDLRRSTRRLNLDFDLVLSVEVLSPAVGERGAQFWSRIAERLSGILADPASRAMLWSNNARPSDRNGDDPSYHAVVADFVLDECDWEGQQPKIGLEVLTFARDLSPRVYTCLMTAYSGRLLRDAEKSSIDWFMAKEEMTTPGGCTTFFLGLEDNIKRRMRSPFWEGILAYVDLPKIVMHAMASTDSKSLRTSSTTNDFFAYYGLNYFGAEASLTLPPLDSLLSPSGPIKESQRLYAEVFGGDSARFTTNGTSNANLILGRALCSAADYFLIDENCHISHHYAYAASGATPVHLAAENVGGADEYSAVTPEQVALQLRFILDKAGDPQFAKLPRAIIITNCTFDGVAVRPDHHFRAVEAVLKEYGIEDRLNDICFVFDEAWWGFAAFHPSLIVYTAMYQARRLKKENGYWRDKLRLYVTHSTHKTLSAFRQTSAIIMSDPTLESEEGGLLSARLDQSYLSHTTTSPHAGMLASFDIARRQADLEGARLISRAIWCAGEFKRWLLEMASEKTVVGRFFRLVADEELLGSMRDRAIVDPTKVTVQLPNALRGPIFKKKLWAEQRVQFNKYSNRRGLLMFTIGFGRIELENLKIKLEKFAQDHQDLLSSEASIEHVEPRPPSFRVMCEDGCIETFPQAVANGKRWNVGRFLLGQGIGKEQQLSIASISEKVANGETVLSAGFITPYPPGFPVIYPGQVLGPAETQRLQISEGVEVHGLVQRNGELLLRVWLP